MIKKKNITMICSEINNILVNEKIVKEKKINITTLSCDLRAALFQDISYDQINEFCELTLKIAKTKGRIIRNIEKNIWLEISELPFRLISNLDIEIKENEEISSSCDYENGIKKIFSRILKLSLEVLKIDDDKSNASDNRRSGALKYIGEMLNYYNIPDSKNIFLESINSTNKQEQYFALTGLEIYYATTEDKLSKKTITELNKIIKQTDDRTVASTCLQIQINAGIIDELSAVCSIDDWKDENW